MIESDFLRRVESGASQTMHLHHLARYAQGGIARIVRGAFSEPWVLSRITAASGSSPIAATDWRPASAR